MSNAMVRVSGGLSMLPTLLGQGLARIPTGGKIRAGIKTLTAKAAAIPAAVDIYERGLAAGDSFVQVEQALLAALLQFLPKNISRIPPVKQCYWKEPCLRHQTLAEIAIPASTMHAKGV